MRSQGYWLQKCGNTPDEYEDAFAADPAARRFAVADGATESGFAARWAQLLVQQFVETPACHPDHWAEGLPAIQQRWSQDVRGHPLPWYAETQFEQGAFATFLGLGFQRSAAQGLRWSAVAVGDACLFQTRAGELLRAFPVVRSEDFGTSPSLVGSRSPVETVQSQRAMRASGTARASDRFWLMTDALAAWFLTEHEAGRKPGDQLAFLVAETANNEAFAASIDALRDAQRLRNDDVTLLAVQVEGGD